MDRRRRIPAWISLGAQAGVVGAMLSAGTLVAFQLSRPEPRLALPNGVDGAMILFPAILALGIFAVWYPTFMAATRADAILGAVSAFLVGADALMIVSVVVGDSVAVHTIGRSLPLGLVGAGLALPVALVALLVGQLSTPLGFGRSAGIRSVLAGAALGLVLALAAAYTI
jgi:hypothetical protein